MSDHSKKRVSYYYDPEIGNYRYGPEHEMKPHRIKMCHHLILNYEIYYQLELYRPKAASFTDIIQFHNEDYINFLKKTTNSANFEKEMLKYNLNFEHDEEKDCPVFEGLYKFCQLSCGGSLAGATKLNKHQSDIVINWMGGLHHAKKSKASGFCYTNDIVLGILELLKYHKRVLYVDIDVHHGDGVEEAFCRTDRVMTVSFHKYGLGRDNTKFFPGTGAIYDVGFYEGKYYAINVPLHDGITDNNYESIFTSVMQKVMEVYQPEVVVLQCGADSLSGDRLGPFNLTLRGHGKCVEFFRKYNVPLMLLGGGGYNAVNVARCWTYETALAVNLEIPDVLPYHDFYDYFAPNYRLHIDPSQANDENDSNYIHSIKSHVFENLNQLGGAPGVQMQQIQPDAIDIDDGAEIDAANPDKRLPTAIADKIIENSGELYDGEKEGGDLRNEQTYKRPAKSGTSPEAKKANGEEEATKERAN